MFHYYKLPSRVRHLLKFGLLVSVAVSFLVTVLLFYKTEEITDFELDKIDMFGENFSDTSLSLENTLGIIHDDVTMCLNKVIQNMQIDASLLPKDFVPTSGKNKSGSDVPTIKLLHQFNAILSSLEIEAAIIEPTFLFCMLRTSFKNLLIRRNFNISSYSTSYVTFGIRLQDALKLEKQKNSDKFRNSGFVASFVYSPVTAWMRRSTNNVSSNTIPSHIFYSHKSFNLHFVVFFERNNFLWHASLDTERNHRLPAENNFHYGKFSGAYETFISVPLARQSNSSAQFNIPSNPHHFLFQIPNSRFLECNMSRAVNVTSDNRHPRKHYKLSVERFNSRTITVIHHLKSIFSPLLLNFWIWSGTMLGWYRQCDIIPYTSDVDFAAWANEVEDLEQIIDLLQHNIYVTLKMRMGILKEALEFQLDCKNLRADVFFMYRIENGSWCSGHSPNLGYYFRYYYPNFTLCSAELLGEKVLVPCETEKVIVNEYGEHWSRPNSSWDYEKSIRNRGPNIYWSKKKLADAYKVYKT